MAKYDPKIFKAYDIRGTYPDQLNEETAYLIGRAFARRAQAKEVIVGSDMRIAAPVIKKAIINGITDEGTDVIDIGLVAIDTVYSSVGIFKYEAGIMVTASHNPPEYIGCKMVLKNMEWIRGKELKEDVENLPQEISEQKGEVRKEDILPRYIDHVLSFVDLKKIKPFKVVVDAGNGMTGKIMPMFQEKLPIKVIPLNFELDGNFPGHPSNPLLPESQKQIKEAVVKEKADFGVIFDGDTDRLFFVHEKGEFIPADMTLLILAKLFLEREPGSGIVYNVVCSKVVPEMIKKWGGRPIRSEVGYVNISKNLKEQKGIMGGEISAHYSFRDNAYADSGFIAFVILLQELSVSDKPLSEIMAPFYKYKKGEEHNIEVNDILGILTEIKKEYQDGEIDELDGVSVRYPNWWFNVRPSNTEPLLRITVEADNEEIYDREYNKLVDYINRIK